MRKHRPRDRADDWALTAVFALAPALILVIIALAHPDNDLGDLVLGAWFALVSLLLYLQSVRVRRHPPAALGSRALQVTSPILIIITVVLTIADLVTSGRL